ncbi:MAG: hypothetical protein J0653_05690, partial [Deltaproteobacteria bacterium]|nr:hypothetical protein [Deltaproteobacteria bacterium]
DMNSEKAIKRPFATHDQDIYCLAASPDGNYLASGGFDGLWIWDIHTGEKIAQLESYMGPGMFDGGVYGIAFS